MSAVVNPAVLVKREACPGCGGRKFLDLVREPFAGPMLAGYLTKQYEGRAQPSALPGDYELARCESCGLAFQVGVPGDALLEDIYDRWIQATERERLHSQYALGDFTYLAEQVHFAILMLGRKPYDIEALDFGMGWGEWAAMARAFGIRVAGAELSQERKNFARSRGLEVVDWDQIPSRRFNFIHTEQVFEHLVNPLDTLRHLSRGLADGGVIRVSVPDARKAVAKLARGTRLDSLSAHEMMTVAPLEHINSFDFSSLSRMGEEAGLALLRPQIRHLYDASSGWLHPKQAIRLLVRPFYRHWYPKSTVAYFIKRTAR